MEPNGGTSYSRHKEQVPLYKKAEDGDISPHLLRQHLDQLEIGERRGSILLFTTLGLLWEAGQRLVLHAD